ncbi:hypothetical protein HPB47_025053 [Ixodes persulcatus]|uniref:Uncharacterized protein n=1 Tax=Ixodes persulcatus TaxID=34615 RepID=A0AC60Q2L0_IXOPE|nr:hypothetical protein HPB47_025053 [Ixodes persulcatus]
MQRPIANHLHCLRLANSKRASQATLTDMAASERTVDFRVVCTGDMSPNCESPDILHALFVQCIESYVAQSGSNTDWALIARATAAMILRSRRRRHCREWIRFLLRSRETFGEFHHLVRDMRLDNGSDFFQYFRMTRQRFDQLLALVGPQLQREATPWRKPISPAERLSLTIRACGFFSKADDQGTLMIDKIVDDVPIQASEENLEAIVWACVSLHNYLRTCDESEQGERRYCPAGYADQEGTLGDVVPGHWRAEVNDGGALVDVGRTSSNMYNDDAKKVRQTYARYFCCPAGEVTWQYKTVYKGLTPAV